MRAKLTLNREFIGGGGGDLSHRNVKLKWPCILQLKPPCGCRHAEVYDFAKSPRGGSIKRKEGNHV
jgi:hypothetical protein